MFWLGVDLALLPCQRRIVYHILAGIARGKMKNLEKVSNGRNGGENAAEQYGRTGTPGRSGRAETPLYPYKGTRQNGADFGGRKLFSLFFKYPLYKPARI